MDIHVGVTIPQIKRSWTQSRDAATAFEAMGYDSLWVCDHLYGPQSPQIPILEAWSLLSAVAAVTDRVELGTLVTPTGMRNVAQLGKTVASVDAIAGGRVIPGFGAGWMDREFTDFGVPFPPVTERLAQMEESIALLTRMWDPDEDEVTFDGEYVQANAVVCQPKPPRRPPVLIGGAGEKVTLRMAAKLADIWNNTAVTQDDLAHKIDVLRWHCDAIGRDPAEVRISQQCVVTIAPDEATAGPMIEQAQKVFGGHLGNPAGEFGISGSPQRVLDQIHKHVDLGCTMFMCEFFGRDTAVAAQLFAEEVLPHLR